jgi:drug/metabolite transporter (DMT)-like permease
MQQNTKGLLYASITAFFWGFLAIALKIATRMFEPVTIVWFRFFIAFLLLAAWQGFHDPSAFRILIRPPLILVLAALGLSWNYLGFTLGVDHTTPGNAQIFIQVGALTLALVGITFFKEHLSRRQILGFILALGGLVLFYHQQEGEFIGSGDHYLKGVLLTLSGALAWALYASLQKILVSKHPVESLNLFLFGLPVLIYLPFINLSPLFHLSLSGWLLMLFLGINTFIAYTCIAKALKYTEANKVSIIIILNPLITFGAMEILDRLNVSWIDAERFTLLTIVGALIVLTGALLVTRQRKKERF